MSLFVVKKLFLIVYGFELIDVMIVVIVVQVCLLVLNLDLLLYDGWVGVVVYLGEFVICKIVQDEDGVVYEVEQDVSGEVWEGGLVILLWEDVQMMDGWDVYNVVIYEFVYKIDMVNGVVDGYLFLFCCWYVLYFDVQVWVDVFEYVYDQFCVCVDVVLDCVWVCFEWDLLIDFYVVDYLLEFFVVCSEVLFV